jgi:hypothetical protein
MECIGSWDVHDEGARFIDAFMAARMLQELEYA